jgi:hypothetical protein
MAQQEDPVRQEIDRLAQGEETELPSDEGTSEMSENGGGENTGTNTADAPRSATDKPDDPSETSRRGMPGYQ